MTRARTLWSPGAEPDRMMLAYTVGDDREVDARLLRWDVIGSLGHLAALRSGGVISERDGKRLRSALLRALRAVDDGTLVIGPEHEDVHSAVELWLTDDTGAAGEQIHAGRSRNDQVVTDIRLYCKHRVLELHGAATALAGALLDFARAHRRVLWPGYTHQRAAMPSSAALWSAAYAEGLLDAVDAVHGFWNRLDRSPLGSAAGYGVPLPLAREAAAKALGFAGIDLVVTTTQNGRGMLEAQLLFWCATIAHECAKLSTDVALFSSDEFGWIRLPAAYSTGSSIMPQKRNPDLFELTRGRAAALEGDLAAIMAIKAKLPGGYHRDFQLIKAPLWRGLDRTADMLGMLRAVVPSLGVDAERARAAMPNSIYATDEAMTRVERGTTFRQAYRDVATTIKQGDAVPTPSAAAVTARRVSTGGIGNVPLRELASRATAARRWSQREQARFDAAIARLTARRAR